MYNKRSLVCISSLLFVIAVINLVSRKYLPYSYTKILPYNQLYYTDEQLRIYDIGQKEGDSLIIRFKGNGIEKNNHFEIFTDSVLTLSQQSENLTIRPDPKQKQFFLRINDHPRKYLINIDYTPLSTYQQAGNSSTTIYEVTSRDMLISPASFYRLSDWDVSSLWREKIRDKSKPDHYLYDSMKVVVTDSTHIKVLKIARYLLNATQGRLGIPSDDMAQLSPIQQLEYVRSGRSQLWCGNYVDLFSFFSSYAGVAGRIVSCGNHVGNTTLGQHSWNEVFLPEWDCWAYVDLTAGNVLVRKGDYFLNTLDLYALLRSGSTANDGTTAYHFNGDSIALTPFQNVTGFARYYFHPGNSFQYIYADFLKRQIPENIFERIKKFFYLWPYYATYSDDIMQGNCQFYFRLVTNYLLVVITVLWLFSVVMYSTKHWLRWLYLNKDENG